MLFKVFFILEKISGEPGCRSTAPNAVATVPAPVLSSCRHQRCRSVVVSAVTVTLSVLLPQFLSPCCRRSASISAVVALPLSMLSQCHFFSVLSQYLSHDCCRSAALSAIVSVPVSVLFLQCQSQSRSQCCRQALGFLFLISRKKY